MTNSDPITMPDRPSSSFCVRATEPALLRGRGKAVRWIGTGVLAVLAPKCVFCVVGYLGLAAGLGTAGVELCGGPDPSRSSVPLSEGVALVLAVALLVWRFHVHRRSPRCGMNRAAR